MTNSADSPVPKADNIIKKPLKEKCYGRIKGY